CTAINICVRIIYIDIKIERKCGVIAGVFHIRSDVKTSKWPSFGNIETCLRRDREIGALEVIDEIVQLLIIHDIFYRRTEGYSLFGAQTECCPHADAVGQ